MDKKFYNYIVWVLLLFVTASLFAFGLYSGYFDGGNVVYVPAIFLTCLWTIYEYLFDREMQFVGFSLGLDQSFSRAIFVAIKFLVWSILAFDIVSG